MHVNELKKIECLSQLTIDELKKLDKTLVSAKVKKGDVVFKEGDKDNDLYFITKGSLRVLKSCAGHEEELHIVKSPSVVGEIAFLIKQPRSATLVAMEDCELLKFSKKAFDAMTSEKNTLVPKLLLYFSEVLSHRLHALDNKVCSIIDKTPANKKDDVIAELENFRNKLFGQWSF